MVMSKFLREINDLTRKEHKDKELSGDDLYDDDNNNNNDDNDDSFDDLALSTEPRIGSGTDLKVCSREVDDSVQEEDKDKEMSNNDDDDDSGDDGDDDFKCNDNDDHGDNDDLFVKK